MRLATDRLSVTVVMLWWLSSGGIGLHRQGGVTDFIAELQREEECFSDTPYGGGFYTVMDSCQAVWALEVLGVLDCIDRKALGELLMSCYWGMGVSMMCQ